MRTTFEQKALFSIMCAAVFIVAFTYLLREPAPINISPNSQRTICTGVQKFSSAPKREIHLRRKRRVNVCAWPNSTYFHPTYTEAEATGHRRRRKTLHEDPELGEGDKLERASRPLEELGYRTGD